jgi:hypothetical protein
MRFRDQFNALPPHFESRRDGSLHAIQFGIHIAACQLLKDLDIPDYQPLVLDVRLFYPAELNALLCTVLRPPGRLIKERIQELLSAECHPQIPLEKFLESIMGAAVNNWCFERFSPKRGFLTSAQGKSAIETIEKSESNSSQSWLHCLLCRLTYL